MDCVERITDHLREKRVYTDEYISRVAEYMEKHPDLAEEFAFSLPKNTFPDHYVSVKGATAKMLGATTLLSRSAIYVVLARYAEEDIPLDSVIQEELTYFTDHRTPISVLKRARIYS